MKDKMIKYLEIAKYYKTGIEEFIENARLCRKTLDEYMILKTKFYEFQLKEDEEIAKGIDPMADWTDDQIKRFKDKFLYQPMGGEIIKRPA